eukprot:SM001087S14122  [mRNA]  locus=s1087:132:542:+ [translate_table: standard]
MTQSMLLVALALGLTLAAVPTAAEWGTMDGYIYQDPGCRDSSPGNHPNTPLKGATVKVTCDYGTGSHGVSGLRSYYAWTNASACPCPTHPANRLRANEKCWPLLWLVPLTAAFPYAHPVHLAFISALEASVQSSMH